jgi:hypothetical protein
VHILTLPFEAGLAGALSVLSAIRVPAIYSPADAAGTTAIASRLCGLVDFAYSPVTAVESG